MNTTVPESNALTFTTPHEPAAKPPTQIAGVVGIAATPVTMNQPAIDWDRLAELPPFQMWAAERLRTEHAGGRNSHEHARDVIRRLGGGRDVFDEYAHWHSTKGYWPNETPFGELKNA